jgi:hypothetical protein
MNGGDAFWGMREWRKAGAGILEESEEEEEECEAR